MEVNERFWNATLEEWKLGFVYDDSEACYICLVCGERFEEGEVFRVPGTERWFDAKRYAAHHVQHAHNSMLEHLLELDKKMTGLTDLQKTLIRQFASGMSDKDIVQRSGSGSASTVRNHRFVLKEKAKQAKLLLAIMELMESGAADAPRFMPVHAGARQVDERYVITEEEYASLMKQYFPHGPEGPLASFPKKEKRKVAVLRHISLSFKHGLKYTEKEVNALLKTFWEDDYVTLRRYLIEYGFLDRKEDGSEYWLNG